MAVARLSCRPSLGDDANWDELTQRQELLARRTGALSVLPLALAERSTMQVYAGKRAVATSLAAEADTVSEATGGQASRHGALFLAAYAGRAARVPGAAERQPAGRGHPGRGAVADRCRVDERAALQQPRSLRGSPGGRGAARRAPPQADWRPGSRPSSSRQPSGAATLPEPRGPCRSLQKWRTPAARTGRWESQHGPGRSCTRARPRSVSIERRSSASDVPASTSALARTHLLYGEWLRRERRRTDAREQLRVAHEMFIDNGMDGFAERARRELLATGETVRRRVAETATSSPRRRSRLLDSRVTGVTNPEIGAQLFISARTVEWHLRKVYPKLGIKSRRQLRSALSVEAPVRWRAFSSHPPRAVRCRGSIRCF